jgi:hypothetical protein
MGDAVTESEARKLLEAVAKRLDARALRIRSHGMYPAYGLNSQEQAVEDDAMLIRNLNIPALLCEIRGDDAK